MDLLCVSYKVQTMKILPMQHKSIKSRINNTLNDKLTLKFTTEN